MAEKDGKGKVPPGFSSEPAAMRRRKPEAPPAPTRENEETRAPPKAKEPEEREIEILPPRPSAGRIPPVPPAGRSTAPAPSPPRSAPVSPPPAPKPLGLGLKPPSFTSAPTEKEETYSPPLPPRPSLPRPGPVAPQPTSAPYGGKKGVNFSGIIALVALAIAVLALFLVLTAPASKLDTATKAELRGIAQDLRAIKDRSVGVQAPVQGSAKVNQNVLLRDILPPTITVPITANIPIQKRVMASSPTMGTVYIDLNETVPVNFNLTLILGENLGQNAIVINKELNVDMQMESKVKTSDLYGTELDDVINRLEKLAQN